MVSYDLYSEDNKDRCTVRKNKYSWKEETQIFILNSEVLITQATFAIRRNIEGISLCYF